MTVTTAQVVLAVLLAVAGVALTRFLPFLVFRPGCPTPPFVAYLGKWLGPRRARTARRLLPARASDDGRAACPRARLHGRDSGAPALEAPDDALDGRRHRPLHAPAPACGPAVKPWAVSHRECRDERTSFGHLGLLMI